jgi:short-subunit dehydrogenase
MEVKNKKMLLLGAVLLGGALACKAIARHSRKYSFKDKVVLITGGSRGLGLVLARALAKEGAQLALAGRSNDALEKAKRELEEKYHTEVFIYSCNLADGAQVKSMTEAVTTKYGKVDVLINNAGIIQIGPENCMTVSDYDEALNTNFWAPLHAIQAVLPEMKKRKAGRIINISSIGGKISVPHMLPYSVSKFALTALSEGLHAELKKDNIYVTTVCPGLMRTGSYRNVSVKGNHQAEFAIFSILSNSPVTSVCAERAARQIICGSRYGDPEIIISLSAKIATIFHGIHPGVTAFWMSMVNKFLPTAENTGEAAVKGYQSESHWSLSFLNLLGQLAAKRNNQLLQ